MTEYEVNVARAQNSPCGIKESANGRPPRDDVLQTARPATSADADDDVMILPNDDDVTIPPHEDDGPAKKPSGRRVQSGRCVTTRVAATRARAQLRSQAAQESQRAAADGPAKKPSGRRVQSGRCGKTRVAATRARAQLMSQAAQESQPAAADVYPLRRSQRRCNRPDAVPAAVGRQIKKVFVDVGTQCDLRVPTDRPDVIPQTSRQRTPDVVAAPAASRGSAARAERGRARDVSELHMAVRDGDLELMALLLDSGADMEHRDAAGATPLHWAVRFLQADAAQLLIDEGADVDAPVAAPAAAATGRSSAKATRQ